jgi:hypothetical protein
VQHDQRRAFAPPLARQGGAFHANGEGARHDQAEPM